jgi:hypothetical protein
MSASCIAFRAARPQDVSEDTPFPSETRRDGWQQFQARNALEAREALERLYERLCLEKYSPGDRNRLLAALSDACFRFLLDLDPAGAARLALRARIQPDCVKVSLECIGDDSSPCADLCEAGILFRGYQLRWAHYRKVDGRLNLVECRVLHS